MNFHVIIIIIFLLNNPIDCSTICSIYSTLNCSCYQSEYDLYHSLPMKTYSHLFCQGNSLTKKTFREPFGSDFLVHNRFRTIALEFSLDHHVEIHRNQFDSLALLFSQTDSNAQIEIAIRFNGFTRIQFHEQSIHSNIFQKKHQKKHLSLHLTPRPLNHLQKESGEENWSAIDEQFDISPNSFSGLILSEMNLYIHTYKDYFPWKYPFEYVFNNTNIGQLHLFGSMISPGTIEMRKSFQGLIRSLTLHRHVDTIDSDNYPYYSSVDSYNIHSIEAHSMDLQTFLPIYKNLRGLTIIKPRFEIIIDRYLPTLESLSLDIEYFNERTISLAKHIQHLKLSSRLRRIDPQALNSLINHLKTFDLSSIDFSSMTLDSRCYLIHFLLHISQRSINVILPQITFLDECDCSRLLLLHLQSNEQIFNENSMCSKQCRFNDCPVISEFFRKIYPLFNEEYQNQDLPSVDLFEDSIDVRTINFLVNQTNEQQQMTIQTPIWSKITKKIIPTTTTTTTTMMMMTFIVVESIREENVELSKSKPFPWIPFVIIFGILFLLIFSFILLFVISYKKRQQSKIVRIEL